MLAAAVAPGLAFLWRVYLAQPYDDGLRRVLRFAPRCQRVTVSNGDYDTEKRSAAQGLLLGNRGFCLLGGNGWRLLAKPFAHLYKALGELSQGVRASLTL